MDKDHTSDHRLLEPANDGALALQHVNDVVLTLAGLLGRQIAREEFERRQREAEAQSHTPPQDDQPTR